jgi:hypothetical protein
MLGLPAGAPISQVFIKPHGCQLCDGRIICWGQAANWKTILLAAHERSFNKSDTRAFAVVLMQSGGRFGDPIARAVVEGAANTLGIEMLRWDS